MPFGLNSALASLQRAVKVVPSRVKRQFVLVCLDDIIVYSKSLTDHLVQLRRVLALLQNVWVKLKFSKSLLFENTVSYLRHAIQPKKMPADNMNYEAVRRCLPPTNHMELRPFLGMSNAFFRFVPNFLQFAFRLKVVTR